MLPKERLERALADERVAEEVRYAASIQKQTGCSRGEALHIAAKWVRKDRGEQSK